jgi:hypothetical protein
MTQTAVELLRKELDAEIKLGTKMVVNWDMYLEMEKQQIIDAFRKGAATHYPPDYTWVDSAWRKEAEQYYNETYGSDETKQ